VDSQRNEDAGVGNAERVQARLQGERCVVLVRCRSSRSKRIENQIRGGVLTVRAPAYESQDSEVSSGSELAYDGDLEVEEDSECTSVFKVLKKDGDKCFELLRIRETLKILANQGCESLFVRSCGMLFVVKNKK